MTNQTEFVDIDNIKHGDTIVCSDGFKRTVSNEDIKSSGFLPKTIFGENYILQKRKVERVLFPRWHQGEIIDYVAQK